MAEYLVEGTFGRLFRLPLHPSELARRLARAMEDEQVIGDDGQVLLPNRYWVFLNPEDYAALGADKEALRAGFGDFLQRLTKEGNGRFSGHLSITLHPASDVAISTRSQNL